MRKVLIIMLALLFLASITQARNNVYIVKILDTETLSDTSPGLTDTKYTTMQNISNHNFLTDIGIVGVNSGTSTDIDIYYEIGVPTLDGNVAIGSDTFFGSGLNDITVGGTFDGYLDSGAMQRRYRIEIDATGTPDTYQWSRNGGRTFEETGVSCTTSAVELDDGITALWAANTGHTINEAWEFDVTNLIWTYQTKAIDTWNIAASDGYESEALKPTKYIRFLADNQSGSATAILSMYLLLNVEN